MSEFELNGSGWKYTATNFLRAGINEVHLTAGSSFIKTPAWISRKQATINVVNFNDDYCFIYCLLAHLYPVKNNRERPESYPQDFHRLFCLEKLQFPLKVSSICRFEKLNPTISVNVFGAENNAIIGPLYHTKQRKENHVNLLLLQSGNKSHYCLITDLSRLLHADITKDNNKIFVCDSCLNHFTTREKYEMHQKDCSLFKPVKITMPEKGAPNSILKFKWHKALLKKGFAIYCDFESFTTPIKNNVPTSNSSYLYEKHEAMAVGYSIVCSFDKNLNSYKSICCENPQVWFVEQMKLEANRLSSILRSEEKPMQQLTLQQNLLHLSTTECPVCGCGFSSDNWLVRHHDHYSGLYEFSCCNNCNLQIQKDLSVAVFFHNLSRYDAHLFIRELARIANVSVIPSNTENYIAFSAWFDIGVRMVFLDSFRFLPESLEKLAGNLHPSQLCLMREYFPDPIEFDLLRRKGVYPYDYMKSRTNLEETQLPAKKYFFNQLTFSEISDADYNHALTVWKTFKCKTMRDYTMLYLKTDILLLSDIFENFRNLTFEHYGLDAACFYTSPGLSFAAALKQTRAKITLLSDIEMYNFISKGVRGGLTNSVTKFAQANNRFMEKFNPDKKISYIHYLDYVNLYGYCLMEPLPVGDFRWLSVEEIARVEEMLLAGQSDYKKYFKLEHDKSIILETNLHYPNEIHDSHSQLPFCAQHIVPEKCTQRKLMCTLEDKERYVIHLKTLEQCLRHGLVLRKIHRVLEFREQAWVKPYIELNTKLRAASKNEFEKNYFKLMVNSIFGKCLECPRKKRDIKLVSNWKSARKLLLKPNFRKATIIDESFVIIELNKTEVVIDKPVFCGFSVLEFSKWKMYDFFYDYIQKNLTDSFTVKLLYLDTDSFLLSFVLKEGEPDKSLSFYDFMRRDASTHFDTSDYPENNVCNIPLVNAKVPGLMKDELKFQILEKWVSLRPKVYSMVVGDNISCKKQTNSEEEKRESIERGERKQTVRRIKGVARSASRTITFDDFYNCLFKNEVVKANFNTIQSKNHQLYTMNVNKLALVNSDNKRYTCPNGIDTLAWGHYSLRKKQE